VSSVLNNDPEYGKKCLTDGLSDTCWQSDTGRKKHCIFVKFTEPIEHLSSYNFVIQFQGGFASKLINITTSNGAKIAVYPEDSNDVQRFSLQELPDSTTCDGVDIELRELTDMFGRLVVYQIDFI
jgi:hypothetical protein